MTGQKQNQQEQSHQEKTVEVEQRINARINRKSEPELYDFVFQEGRNTSDFVRAKLREAMYREKFGITEVTKAVPVAVEQVAPVEQSPVETTGKEEVVEQVVEEVEELKTGTNEEEKTPVDFSGNTSKGLFDM
ncbi:hypothetical protein [Bacillus wiedmannii]|uniref:hypothetical protein n=1 Tax=Bacillus wiedmannii TaxID=1890302 RepID=UPI0021D0D0C7|nr:hypothetical protein [Bacillus wiedmannii]MCU5096125.1 hypothetical protein [Bacillus wiedmannii]